MQVITKILGLIFQVRALRYLFLVFGIAYVIPSQVLAKQANLTIHDDNKFTELSVYQDRPMGMAMINMKDGPQIITAYADNHCNVHGQLSIVKTSTTDPNAFSYLQPCISANSVDNVVLKKDVNNNVYVAYIENGSNNQIHLQWLKNGEDKFTEFQHSEQLTGKNPIYIDLAIDNFSQPVIVYTAKDGHITYLYALKYKNNVEDASKSGFAFYTPGQQGLDLQVNPASRPRIAYNLLGDLYIAYTDKELGLVKFDSDLKWSYIDSVANLSISKNFYSSPGFNNAFDMVINGNMLYLAGIDFLGNLVDSIAVFSYDTERDLTFKGYKRFHTPHHYAVNSLKLYVNPMGELDSSILTQESGVLNSYFVGAFYNNDGESKAYASFENYTNSIPVDHLANDVSVSSNASTNYYLYKYNNNSTDTDNDVAFAYKMNWFTSHDDNQFKLLHVYKDRQVAMFKTDGQIITAYADNTCFIPGQLSLVQASITDPEEFSYLQRCISGNSVDNVILKKDGNDNLYLAYIENGSNNQIHLQWLKNGEDKFTDFPHSDQLTGKHPEHINLIINKVTNKPVIVYTAKDGRIAYLYVLKYDDYVEDENSGFTLYTPGQQGLDLQVSSSSFPRIAYNLSGDLYIAYAGNKVGLVELDSNNKWSFISDIGHLPINYNYTYVPYFTYFSNAFDMTISSNKLYLAGLDATHCNSDISDSYDCNHVVVYTYDTDLTHNNQRKFGFQTDFYTPNNEDLRNLKISVDDVTKNIYLSIITGQYYAGGVFNAYYSGIDMLSNKFTTYNSIENCTTNVAHTASSSFVLNSDTMNNMNAIGFGVARDGDPLNHEPFSYKMTLIKKRVY